MNLSIDGQPVSVPEGASFGEAFKSALSGKRFKSVVAAKVDGALFDLSSPAPADAAVASVTVDTPEGLEILRLSAAHIMAEAVQRLFPKAKVTIGPAID